MKSSLLFECLKLAKAKNTSEHHPEWGNYHHFSFVIQENKIVEWSTNRKGSFGKKHGFLDKRHKIHSEVDAIRKAKGILKKNKKIELVNIRLNKNGDQRISKPCPLCKRFAKSFGVKEIHYSTETGFDKA